MDLVPRGELEQHAAVHAARHRAARQRASTPQCSPALRGQETRSRRRCSIRALIAGLGNIYVCEALYRARLSPKRAAATIADRNGKPNERARSAGRRDQAVLDDAIEAGGSSLRDYRRSRRRARLFPARFGVYDREGEALPEQGCAATVSRIVQTAARPSIARRARTSGLLMSRSLSREATRTRHSATRPSSSRPSGKVGPHHAQPAAGAQRAEPALDRRARPRARRLRGRPGDRLHRHHRHREGLRRRRRHQGDARQDLRRGLSAATSRAVDRVGALPQADHRRGRGLCARRRLRARHDVRHHHRRRQRRIRPARDQARRHAGHRRHAAADPRRRQGQGDGDVPDRPA